MIATIQETKFFELKRQDKIYAWMTRSICTATTLDLPRGKEGEEDPIAAWINTLTLDPDEAKYLEEQSKKALPKQKSINDQPGSMERLIGMFSGSPVG